MHVRALIFALVTLFAAPAAAQPIVLLVDAGSSMDGDALRRAVADRTGRNVVRLGDPAARGSHETLAIARVAADRFHVRWTLGESMAGLERAVPRRGRLDVLADAAAELLFANGRSHDALATVPGADLMEPFARPLWDPLADALSRELHRPFPPGPTYADVVDPFRPIEADVALVDPWAL